MNTREDTLRLSRGDGWAGTFALATEFVLTDILSDGAPIDATVILDDDTTVTGTIERVGGHVIYFDNGHQVETETVVELVI